LAETRPGALVRKPVTSRQNGDIQTMMEFADRMADLARSSRGAAIRVAFLEYFDAVPSGQAACGWALREAQRVVVRDVTDSPVFHNSPALEVVLDAGVRSVQSTPLLSA